MKRNKNVEYKKVNMQIVMTEEEQPTNTLMISTILTILLNLDSQMTTEDLQKVTYEKIPKNKGILTDQNCSAL